MYRKAIDYSRLLQNISSCFIISIIFCSCGTTLRPKDYDLSKDSRPINEKKQLVLSATKSVTDADPSIIIIDSLIIETNKFPKEIRSHARVYDSTGNIIINMAPPYCDDLRYWKSIKETIGKKTYGITDFNVREFGDKDSIPYAVMLNIDYSGSMSGVLDVISEGTELFISLKQPQDRIGIATYNRDYTLKVPMWQDKTMILSTFRSTAKNGFGMYSAMNDALMKSMMQYKDLPPEMPRVMVLFTDGEDNYSTSRVNQIIDSALSNDVHIFTVGFGYVNEKPLRALSGYTGGKFYRAYSKQELINVFKDIYLSLRNFYLISYKPPEYFGLHKVAVELSIPNRVDSLIAKGVYDTAPLRPIFDGNNPNDPIGAQFTSKIIFDFNSATLRPESMIRIDELAELLDRYPRVWLEVQGHTDNVGTEEFNQKLSEARADSVMQELLKRGIESKRLRPHGYGMSDPIVPNDTEENRAKNRRTQFKVLRQ
ncbi:MAG: OmpA family protein [Ignavibacteriae bacterium]|nr:OmpA family protein [Ignavibacteriota bacterium]